MYMRVCNKRGLAGASFACEKGSLKENAQSVDEQMIHDSCGRARVGTAREPFPQQDPIEWLTQN